MNNILPIKLNGVAFYFCKDNCHVVFMRGVDGATGMTAPMDQFNLSQATEGAKRLGYEPSCSLPVCVNAECSGLPDKPDGVAMGFCFVPARRK